MGGNDTLFGDDGNDSLDGGSGSDMLTGGAGTNEFVFASTLDGLANIGRITDLAGDRVVYDSSNGQLWYDADGVGGQDAILFATVTPVTSISSEVFWVV